MSNPSSTSDVPPPVPTKKKKFLVDEKEEEDLESNQLSSDAIDVAAKFQRALDAFKKYKKQNGILEKEKEDLLAQNYNLRIQVDQARNSIDELVSRIESEKRRYQQRANNSDLEIQDLKRQIMQLKTEASQLQSRLGSATSVHWGDNDANNSVQLKNTISGIQSELEELTSVKGKEIVINEENATQLFQQYRCTMRTGEAKAKVVLSAVLQRLILETLFFHLNRYLLQSDASNLRQKIQSQLPPANQQASPRQHNPVKPNPRSSSLGLPHALEQNNNLEVEITATMISLCDLLSQLTESRQGSDDVSRVTPIKIRQQIYAILGTRGFCKEGHPFIEKLSNIILETLGKYRQFKSEERNLEARKKTIELVREIVHLYFRLKALEPAPEFNEFIEAGSSIQNNVMDGSWDDDSTEDLEVEVCYFPIISVKNKDNTRKVLCKGQVITRPKQ
ncbi:15915_t:CDS:2 [Acaulospora colombiana]|uniref:15915_t:CDS:1 n=1 Tax=Acaulospora colombiana TaxID=27376 RepID=A0ACA9LSZ6_9GLOM|nr:15915_t:CDS:2 [Acaulospora colombiana]